jgi:hypothetical protein
MFCVFRDRDARPLKEGFPVRVEVNKSLTLVHYFGIPTPSPPVKVWQPMAFLHFSFCTFHFPLSPVSGIPPTA